MPGHECREAPDALDARVGGGRVGKVLAELLHALTGHQVLERRRYQDHPPRHEYLLT
ncbi:winged helix-turn-helix transcriptional regulator [Streptomyces echinatus]|uniref:winged helix-turn-helix transcriptional regulator n=1 Tax=Streptomyces echinatus TaxID=67293 RepID=UPI00379BA7D2